MQKYGGISRYFYALTQEFQTNRNIISSTAISFSNNHYIKNCDFIKHYCFNTTRLTNYLNKKNSIKQLNKQNFDIFHPTYYDPYFLNYLKNKPFVLTVYDMIHEKFPNMYNSKDKTVKNKALLIKKAAKIIDIS